MNKDELRAYKAAWRAKNREKMRAYYAEYRSKNRDTIRVNQAKYYKKETTKERLRAYHRELRVVDPERARKRQNAYYARNKKVCLERIKEQRLKKPQQYRAYDHMRRARRKGAGGKFTAQDVAEIRTMQRGKCAYCKTLLSRIKEHVDHIMPIALGGTNNRSNIQLLCAPCNLQKHARHPVVHAQSLGLLL